MDTQAHFVAFLQNTVNLRDWKLGQLDTHVSAIVGALQKDALIGPMYKEHIPQGSWAHETIIDPVGYLDEYDADFLLHLTETPAWDDGKGMYLRKVRAALKANVVYKDKVARKNRCVRIVYAGDCHVDVVPSLVLSDGREVIINYATGDYEDTNPAGFTEWMRERDDLTGGNLRKVLRLLKYIRDSKHTFDCKSVILTALFGGRVQTFDTDTRYADIGTTLVTLLEDLSDWLDLYPQMPLVDDPSCPGTSFNHRWDEQRYQTFKTKMRQYAGWAREALDAPEEKALALWQKLFGSEFVSVEVTQLSKSLTASGSSLLSMRMRARARLELAAPNEEFVETKGYGFVPRYTARIDARIAELHGFRHRHLRGQRPVPRGATIKFRLVTDTPDNYEVLWKVRNFGAAATDAGDLRGRLMPGNGRLDWTETAKYPGRHWVEVYVVHNDVVVATDHQNVVIA